MLFTNLAETRFAQLFAKFLYFNPFQHQPCDELRSELLEIELGVAKESLQQPPIASTRPPIVRLTQKIDAWLRVLKLRIQRGATVTNANEQWQFQTLIMGVLFYRYFEARRPQQEAADGTGRVRSYQAFADELKDWTALPFDFSPFLKKPEHMFAVFFQLSRSYDLISELVRGNSRPINLLRAEIWHSIFPHELQLYGTLLFDRMHDITTLILGPSGTGKDLVAMAIGLSRYIPFSATKGRFTETLSGAFHPINLSAMPLNLIESELFGHCAGAFTGAAKDRQGWFENCKSGHTVFLDEIGELDLAIQVKLLRVLQNREFFRVGETEPRSFLGKVIAATNRDFGEEISAGRFRQDLFYRLCSNVLRTPSLREQLDDSPGELPYLVRIIAEKCLGELATSEQLDWLSRLTVDWIESSPDLGTHYGWPGNFRELEQCVRNVMVRGKYHPQRLRYVAKDSRSLTLVSPNHLDSTNFAVDEFIRKVRATELTFDELLDHYCSLVFSRSAHLTAAARQLKKHRATIEARIQVELVEKFRNGRGAS